MAKQVKLVSLVNHEYDKRQLDIGDEFNATEVHARLLVALRRADRIDIPDEHEYKHRMMKPAQRAKREQLKLKKKHPDLDLEVTEKPKRNLGETPDIFDEAGKVSAVSEAFSGGSYNRRDLKAQE